MRIDVLRFNGQLEVPGMASSSRYRITAAEGFAMTVTQFGVLARHDRRELDVLIPWARIDSVDVLPEAEKSAGETFADARQMLESPIPAACLHPVGEGACALAENHSGDHSNTAIETVQVKRGPGRPRKIVA